MSDLTQELANIIRDYVQKVVAAERAVLVAELADLRARVSKLERAELMEKKQ